MPTIHVITHQSVAVAIAVPLSSSEGAAVPSSVLASCNELDELLMVAGIDTHKRTHHVAVLDHLGRDVADCPFVTTAEGYAELVQFLRAHGHVERVGVEGTGSYGAGIARVLTAAGFVVVEVVRQNRQARRLRGKSDPIDVRRAALSVLAGTDSAVPKSANGQAESLRILTSERRSAVKARRQAINQIHALLVTAPEPVRGTYRALSGDKLLDALARAHPDTRGVEPGDVARQALKRLALRCAALRDEITTIQTQLDVLVRSVNPRLLTLHGVGVVTAATLLSAAGDNPERLVSKAAFAALTGVAPIPASSGQRPLPHTPYRQRGLRRPHRSRPSRNPRTPAPSDPPRTRHPSQRSRHHCQRALPATAQIRDRHPQRPRTRRAGRCPTRADRSRFTGLTPIGASTSKDLTMTSDEYSDS